MIEYVYSRLLYSSRSLSYCRDLEGCYLQSLMVKPERLQTSTNIYETCLNVITILDYGLVSLHEIQIMCPLGFRDLIKYKRSKHTIV